MAWQPGPEYEGFKQRLRAGQVQPQLNDPHDVMMVLHMAAQDDAVPEDAIYLRCVRSTFPKLEQARSYLLQCVCSAQPAIRREASKYFSSLPGLWNDTCQSIISVLATRPHTPEDSRFHLGALLVIEECISQYKNFPWVDSLAKPLFACLKDPLTCLACLQAIVSAEAVFTAEPEIFEAVCAIPESNEQITESLAKEICTFFVLSVELSPIVSHFLPKVIKIIDGFARQFADREMVTVEVGEFFLALSDSPLQDALKALLPSIVPFLLKNVEATDEFLEHEKLLYEDAEKPLDYQEDENFNEAREKYANMEPDNGEGDAQKNAEEDEEDDLDDGANAWVTRKACAATLDAIAGHHGSALFESLGPILQNRIQEEQLYISVRAEQPDAKFNELNLPFEVSALRWKSLEACVLVLGAISEGCEAQLTPSINELFTFVLKCTTHCQPRVRATACWTLSRLYHIHNNPEAIIDDVIDMILIRGLDTRGQVQEAAWSSLASLMETWQDYVTQVHLDCVFEAGKALLAHAKRHPRLLVLDAISTAADEIPALNFEDFTAFLLQRFKANGLVESMEILETFSSLCAVNKAVVVEPLVQLIPHLLEKLATLEEDQLLANLDCISALAEHHGPELLLDYYEQLHTLILASVSLNARSSVLQSVFALIGDSCQIKTMPAEHAAKYLELAMQCSNIQDERVLTNLAWACSEICATAEEAFLLPIIPSMVEKLLLIAQGRTKSAAINAVIGIGRMANRFPEVVRMINISPVLLQEIMKTIVDQKPSVETQEASQGFQKLKLDDGP
eukprot:m.112092 g.112092  ORF g.112092 m.112092 type:complete len:793 (-) comp22811_c0_seq2:42-2420(-)